MKLHIALIKPLLKLQREANGQSYNDTETALLFVDKVADYCCGLSEPERKVVLFLLTTQFDVTSELCEICELTEKAAA